MKWLKTILIAGLIMSITVPVPPAFGITPAEEEELSRQFMKEVFHRFNLIEDYHIASYVSNIGQKIVSGLKENPFSYHFYVIKKSEYNAFATPAGHIFIYSGLLEAMDSEDELAGILAHEIAHVHCRHISQKIDRSSKMSLATLAGMAAGIFLGIGGAGNAAQALTVGSVAAAQSLELAYSREDEMQADQIGLAILNQRGYRAEGLLAILEKIRERQWFGKNQIPTYLTTHPAVEDRMAYIDTWVENHPKPEKTQKDTAFLKVKTRLKALHGDEKAALDHFKRLIEKKPDDMLANYGYGLALSRFGDRKKAIDHLHKALEKAPLDPVMLTDLGIIQFFDGRISQAKETFKGAVSLKIQNPEGRFYLGRTQIESRDYSAAINTLEDLIKDYSNYHQAYYFLGEAHGKNGQLPTAHFYLGIYYQKKRDFKNARFHFLKALNGIQDLEKRNEITRRLSKLPKSMQPKKGIQTEEKKFIKYDSEAIKMRKMH